MQKRYTRFGARFAHFLLVPMLFIGNTSQAELPTLGDPTLDSISTREEAQLGLSYYRYLKASLPIVEDIQLNYYLESLAQKLVTQSDEAGRKFTFFIVQSPVINAFALPAGYIGVHSGLFLDADNESQLASVLAHEISHVTQRHLARMIDESGNSMMINIATLLAAILVGSQDSEMGQAVLMGNFADGANMVDVVDSAGFARLRQADGRQLTGMDMADREGLDRRHHVLRPHPAFTAGNQAQPRAIGLQGDAAAFIDFDVAVGMTQHNAARPAGGGQRQTICRSAGAHKEHRHIGLENLAKPLFDPGIGIAGAIGAAIL